MSNNVKASVVQNITKAEIISTLVVSDETKLRFVVSNADSGNIISVKGRIVGQLDWDDITTLTGTNKTLVTVKTYDEVIIECTTFSSLTDFVRVVASSFNEAGGSTTIDAPTGGQIDSDSITLTSSNNSILITNDPNTNSIDFVAVGTAGTSKYIETVVLGDWTGPASGEYTLSIPFSTHGIINPSVICYEINGGVFDLVQAYVNIDTSNNVIIKVTQTPDLRFAGKIVII